MSERLSPRDRELLQFLWDNGIVVRFDKIPPHLKSKLARRLSEPKGQRWVRMIASPGAKPRVLPDEDDKDDRCDPPSPFVELLRPGIRSLEEDKDWDEPTGNAKPRKDSPKRTSVNECMAAMLLEDPTRAGWSATKWVEAVSSRLKRKVSDAAVKQTSTWTKQIIPGRALMKAERIDRKR